MQSISFKRSVEPTRAAGNSSLITFSDTAKQAFQACVNVRWELENDKFESRFVAAKGGVA